jgi:hypothetical protein
MPNAEFEATTMKQAQFDSITRLFSERRTRRAALAAAGAGVAAIGLARAAAQDATPEASPVALEFSDAAGTPFMFVQTFASGSLTPTEGSEGELVLAADHGAGQTLFFSDRPERIVGMVPTEDFLGASGTGGLGYTPADPPNAALVIAGENGSPSEILVVELMDPKYDAAEASVTYTVKVLEDVSSIDLNLEQVSPAATDTAREFGAASLFIDDCPDGEVYCIIGLDTPVNVYSSGFCWDESGLCCYACANSGLGWWSDYCNRNNPGCNGQCQATFRETWACNPD